MEAAVDPSYAENGIVADRAAKLPPGRLPDASRTPRFPASDPSYELEGILEQFSAPQMKQDVAVDKASRPSTPSGAAEAQGDTGATETAAQLHAVQVDRAEVAHQVEEHEEEEPVVVQAEDVDAASGPTHPPALDGALEAADGAGDAEAPVGEGLQQAAVEQVEPTQEDEAAPAAVVAAEQVATLEPALRAFDAEPTETTDQAEVAVEDADEHPQDEDSEPEGKPDTVEQEEPMEEPTEPRDEPVAGAEAQAEDAPAADELAPTRPATPQASDETTAHGTEDQGGAFASGPTHPPALDGALEAADGAGDAEAPVGEGLQQAAVEQVEPTQEDEAAPAAVVAAEQVATLEPALRAFDAEPTETTDQAEVAVEDADEHPQDEDSEPEGKPDTVEQEEPMEEPTEPRDEPVAGAEAQAEDAPAADELAPTRPATPQASDETTAHGTEDQGGAFATEDTAQPHVVPSSRIEVDQTEEQHDEELVTVLDGVAVEDTDGAGEVEAEEDDEDGEEKEWGPGATQPAPGGSEWGPGFTQPMPGGSQLPNEVTGSDAVPDADEEAEDDEPLGPGGTQELEIPPAATLPQAMQPSETTPGHAEDAEATETDAPEAPAEVETADADATAEMQPTMEAEPEAEVDTHEQAWEQPTEEPSEESMERPTAAAEEPAIEAPAAAGVPAEEAEEVEEAEEAEEADAAALQAKPDAEVDVADGTENAAILPKPATMAPAPAPTSPPPRPAPSASTITSGPIPSLVAEAELAESEQAKASRAAADAELLAASLQRDTVNEADRATCAARAAAAAAQAAQASARANAAAENAAARILGPETRSRPTAAASSLDGAARPTKVARISAEHAASPRAASSQAATAASAAFADAAAVPQPAAQAAGPRTASSRPSDSVRTRGLVIEPDGVLMRVTPRPAPPMDAQSWQTRRRRAASLAPMSGGGGGGGIFAQARSGGSAYGQPTHEDDEQPVQKGEGRSSHGLKRRRAAGAHVAPDDSAESPAPTDSLAASDARLLRELDAKASAPKMRRAVQRGVQVGLGSAEEALEKEMHEENDGEQAVDDQDATFPQEVMEEGEDEEDDDDDEEEEEEAVAAPEQEQEEEEVEQDEQEQQPKQVEQERELHDDDDDDVDDDDDMVPSWESDANKETLRREYSLPMRAIREYAEHEGMREVMSVSARRRHELVSAVRAVQQSLEDVPLRCKTPSIDASMSAVVRMVSAASVLPKPPQPLLVLRSAPAVAAAPQGAQADEARCENAFVGAARFVCRRIMQCDNTVRKVHKFLDQIAPKPKKAEAPSEGKQTSLAARLRKLSAEMNRLSNDESSFEWPGTTSYEDDLEVVLDELDAAAERWMPPGRRGNATLPFLWQLGHGANAGPDKRAAAVAPGHAPRAKRAAAPDRLASASTSAKRPHAQMDMFA